MRDQNPIRTARRQVRQKERESRGLAVSPCVLCIQDHHTAGRNHDSQLTAPVCELHHRELHELMLQGGVSLRFEPETRTRVAQALRASAVYDRRRADAMERWADLLDGWKGEPLMNAIAKDSRKATLGEASGFDLLLICMFKMALPVWERYEGRVPAPALRRLERAGDWPRELAAVNVKRLTEDEELRKWIHKLLIEGRANGEVVDDSTA